MAVWLVRILDGDDPEPGDSAGFVDVDDGAWWAPFVRRLAELGVTEGCSQQPARFCGDDAVTRAQMATFLARAFDLPAADPAGFEDVEGGAHAANIDALFAAGDHRGLRPRPAALLPPAAHQPRPHGHLPAPRPATGALTPRPPTGPPPRPAPRY